MRLIDADDLKKAFYNQECWNIVIGSIIDNAPTVTPDKIQALMSDYLVYRCEPERPQGEWVRKEDIIHYIATQYSEHNELVPIWLNIGDMKGGAE